MTAKPTLTPMMEQWYNAKQSHPDAILLFRMGDFYELFDNDAIIAAPILDLTLTSRDKDKAGMKMAGFPFHAADAYIEKLVEHGFKVAVCEQLEDPKLKKGIVKRGITNVITPGTALISESHTHHEPQYLVALKSDAQTIAIAALDLQSSAFMVSSSTNIASIDGEIARIMPREIVVNSDDEQAIKLADAYKTKSRNDSAIRIEKRISNYVNSMAQAFGNVTLTVAEHAATALLLGYVKDLKGAIFAHIGLPKRYGINDQLLMDEASRFNLDLVPKKKGDRHNLYTLLCDVKTVVGRRALFHRLMAPSTSLREINDRLDDVDDLVKADALRSQLREELSGFYDLEKLVALACAMKISPRGLAHIKRSLHVVDTLKTLAPARHTRFDQLLKTLPDYSACLSALESALVDEPPLNVKDGGIFKRGYDRDLDSVIDLVNNGKELMLALESREREATRISSLKIKFTRVFGYYIEITKTHLDKVPAHYQRKQTIANGERFTTAELIDLEGRLSSAEDNALQIEEAHFHKLKQVVIDCASDLLSVARTIAHADVTATFASLAVERDWVKPKVLEAQAHTVDIKAGRHPLIEALALENGNYFVPNDISLNSDEQSIALITGPNMAGKSTIMRTVALAQIMAQMGSFVVAKSATLSIADAVFARVGASDDPAHGRSTFMVEMTEAAAILANATKASLIILDEIGRGTSTYDGMSIAQAVCEYIHDHVKARTLFATHYHELTHLHSKLALLKNFHVGVEEKDQRIRFLYSLVSGPCLKSFGIEVARLSGLPSSVLDRAMLILQNLESRESAEQPTISAAPQLVLFQQKSLDDELAKKILTTDVNRLTPLQALNKIAVWQQALRKVDRDDGASLEQTNLLF